MLKTIQLPDTTVVRLLSYLEHLVCSPEQTPLKTDLLKQDILQVMQDISAQTGLDLPKNMPTQPSAEEKLTSSVCAHLYTARGICAICTEPKPSNA